MKIIFFIVAVVFLSLGCEEAGRGHLVDLELRNGERVIFSKDLIPDFDTIYSWIHTSDSKCDDLNKIRLSDNRLPIKMEDGFMGASSFMKRQLTIIQYANDCGKETRSIHEILEDEVRFHNEAYLDSSGDSLVVNEVLDVNGRKFAVVGWVNLLPTNQDITFEEHLNARTIVDGSLLRFEYESCCFPRSDFLENMVNHVMTIKIKEDHL